MNLLRSVLVFTAMCILLTDGTTVKAPRKAIGERVVNKLVEPVSVSKGSTPANATRKATRKQVLDELARRVSVAKDRREQMKENMKRRKLVRTTIVKMPPRTTLIPKTRQIKPTILSAVKYGECKDLPVYPFHDEEGFLIQCESYLRLHGKSFCSEPEMKVYCCYTCAPSAVKSKLKVKPEKMVLLSLSHVHDSEDIV